MVILYNQAVELKSIMDIFMMFRLPSQLLIKERSVEPVQTRAVAE